MGRSPIRLSAAAVLACGLLGSTATAGQELARIGVDSTVAVDQFVGESTAGRPNVVVDVSAVVRIGGGWRAFVRPWFRQAASSPWSKQIYQAMIQHERSGRISSRIDLGYLASPVGLGMMDSRPGVNPTISGHSAYFALLPAFDPGGPRVQAIAATYPLGGQVTVSTSKWDARGAVVRSAPTRVAAINRPGSPRDTPAVAGGLGFTPRTGVRIGASVVHGRYARADELPSAGASRAVTMAGIEGEVAAGYTKVAGEFVLTDYGSTRGQLRAYTWFAQGTRTLTPRWFIAARQEGVSAPPAAEGVLAGRRSRLLSAEATAGYRLSTDLTLRTSLVARKPFAGSDWNRQLGVSVVWARRWW